MSAKPLTGICVLTLEQFGAGPYGTMFLAELGAEVIKVEPPEGDLTRVTNPRVNGLSTYFIQQNTGKRNISVDTTRPEGVRLLLRLAERSPLADRVVVLEAEAKRVHARVARRAHRAGAMDLHALPQRCHLHLSRIFLEIGFHSRRRLRRRRTEQVLEHPLAALPAAHRSGS